MGSSFRAVGWFFPSLLIYIKKWKQNNHYKQTAQTLSPIAHPKKIPATQSFTSTAGITNCSLSRLKFLGGDCVENQDYLPPQKVKIRSPHTNTHCDCQTRISRWDHLKLGSPREFHAPFFGWFPQDEKKAHEKLNLLVSQQFRLPSRG